MGKSDISQEAKMESEFEWRSIYWKKLNTIYLSIYLAVCQNKYINKWYKVLLN